MFRRGEIINSVKPSAVISVHMNFYSASSRRGAQVFFDRRDDGGRQLAVIMQDALNRDFNMAGGGRKKSDLSAGKYILKVFGLERGKVHFVLQPLSQHNRGMRLFEQSLRRSQSDRSGLSGEACADALCGSKRFFERE